MRNFYRKMRLTKLNLVFTLLFLLLFSYYFWAFFSNDGNSEILSMQSPFKLIFINFIDRKNFQISSNADSQIFGKMNNHFGLFRLTNNGLDVTSFSSIKHPFKSGFNGFPYKTSLFQPPLKTKNGLYNQGLCGISRYSDWQPDYAYMFKKYENNKNPSNFLNLKEHDLFLLDNIVEKKNIIIRENVLSNLTENEEALLFLLSNIKKPLATFDYKLAWSFFEHHKFTEKERFEMLVESNLRFKLLGGFDDIVKLQLEIVHQGLSPTDTFVALSSTFDDIDNNC